MYIESFENRALTKLRTRWRKGECYGVYVLHGPTGCGKTTFLNSIFNDNVPIARYTGRDMADMILSALHNRTSVTAPSEKVIFIESIDDVLYATATSIEIFRLANKWASEEKRLIIFTSRYSEGLKTNRWLKPVEMKPLKVKKKTILAAAENKKMALTHRQLRQLRRCPSMNDLNEKLNRIMLSGSITGISEQ